MGCRSPLPLHRMLCGGTEDAVSLPGSSLLSVVAFSANPCAAGTAQVSFAQRGMRQSPCSLGKAPGVMSKKLKKKRNKKGKLRIAVAEVHSLGAAPALWHSLCHSLWSE